MTTDALFDALERLEQPSAALDDEIARAVRRAPSPFTVDIRSALALVPLGWSWSIDWRPNIWWRSRAKVFAGDDVIVGGARIEERGRLPTAALCMAAMRAMIRTGTIDA